MPIVRNTIVMAPDTPVRDQPVASAIGCRNTASENTAPIGDASQQAAGGDHDPTVKELHRSILDEGPGLYLT